jgi:FAD/FMN-containing dehydrogenase
VVKDSVLAESVSVVKGSVVRSIGWANWSGTETSKLARVATPGSEAEVVDEISRARANGLRVKAIGAGHSFTGVAVTDGVQLRLGALTGVTSIDSTRGEATVRAGTPLHVLNEELAAFGCALPNLGDIDRQSLAGAIGTGTHGTGLRLTGLAAGVRALRLVLADGSVVDCSPTREPELFQAARLGLGALGVVTEITVAVVPAFLLHAVERPEAQLHTVGDTHAREGVAGADRLDPQAVRAGPRDLVDDLRLAAGRRDPREPRRLGAGPVGPLDAADDATLHHAHALGQHTALHHGRSPLARRPGRLRRC